MGKLIRGFFRKRKRPIMAMTISATIDAPACLPCRSCGSIIMGQRYKVEVMVGVEKKVVNDLCHVCYNKINKQ